MKIDTTVLDDPRFWAGYLATSFGEIGEPIDSDDACSAFGVSEHSAQKWWNEYTGWYEGVIDETDGWLENPSGVAVSFAPTLTLEIEIHPGGTMYFLTSAELSRRHLVGEVGGDWRLPMFRWSEVSHLAPNALVLALPGVWVDDTEPGCRDAVENAFRALPLKSSSSAAKLTDQWFLSVADGARSYSWSQHPTLGWVSIAHWSMRSIHAAEHGVDVRSINDILLRAGIR